MMDEPLYYYRYEASLDNFDEHFNTVDTLILYRFRVDKKTPKGAWIFAWGYRRFVLDGAGKRFAHQTPEMARSYYLRRKYKFCRFAKAKLERAEREYALAIAYSPVEETCNG